MNLKESSLMSLSKAYSRTCFQQVIQYNDEVNDILASKWALLQVQ